MFRGAWQRVALHFGDCVNQKVKKLILAIDFERKREYNVVD